MGRGDGASPPVMYLLLATITAVWLGLVTKGAGQE